MALDKILGESQPVVVQAPSSISGRLSCRDSRVFKPTLFLKICRTVNLEIFYIISFNPTTICNLVAGLSFSLDISVVVGVVLRSVVILFQLTELIFAFIES